MKRAEQTMIKNLREAVQAGHPYLVMSLADGQTTFSCSGDGGEVMTMISSAVQYMCEASRISEEQLLSDWLRGVKK